MLFIYSSPNEKTQISSIYSIKLKHKQILFRRVLEYFTTNIENVFTFFFTLSFSHYKRFTAVSDYKFSFKFHPQNTRMLSSDSIQ